MNFDDKIKARAKGEGSPVPEGFERRMDALLEGLPEKASRKRRGFNPKRAAVIAVAAVFVMGAGAAAVPSVLTMTQGVIEYFGEKKDSQYADKLNEFEKYNAAVGASETRGDETLTIDNISADDSFLNIFYTLKSTKPIEKFGDDSDPENWRAKWTAPIFWAEVDGEQLDTTGSVLSEAAFTDDCTLTGMHRLPLRETLPDTFNLVLYTGGTSEKLDSEYRFSLAIDKSAVTVNSLTVEPKLDWHITHGELRFDGGGPEDVIPPESFDVRVERVSISPLSSTVTLSEVSEMPFNGFAIRDDKGKYLPICDGGGIVGSSELLHNRVKNMFEFMGADTDTKSLTLIPLMSPGRGHQVSGKLDELPLTDDSENGFTLESIDVGRTQAVAKFSIKGVVDMAYVQCELLDENGELIDFEHSCGIDSSVNRETGEVISTLYYPQATDEEFAKIKGVMFWQPDPGILLEDQAITVNLQ